LLGFLKVGEDLCIEDSEREREREKMWRICRRLNVKGRGDFMMVMIKCLGGEERENIGGR